MRITTHLAAAALGVALLAGWQAGGATDAGSAQEAEALLRTVTETYRSVPTLTDAMTVTAKSHMGTNSQELSVTLGPEGSMRLVVPGMTIAVLDDTVYALRDDIGHRYAAFPAGDNAVATLSTQLKEAYGQSVLPVQLHMRYGSPHDDVVESLGLGMLQNPKLRGVTTVTTDDGATRRRIDLVGDNGEAGLQVDPDRNLVTRFEMTMTVPGAPDPVNATIEFDPQVHDALDEPIAFDPGDRARAESIKGIEPKPLKVGDAAPDFRLPALDGEEIALADLKGQVVVLDFWATWCGPCRRGLPLVNDVAKWAEAGEVPVRIFGVDTFERFDSREKQDTEVRRYWGEQEFAFPTLMDYDSRVVSMYGIQSIPTTIVIGPDGTVRKVHKGYSAAMADALKATIETILAGS
ncbi:MAG: TlpA family protein disulfide reductase [Planctomycetota bacterium]|jgi:peroxiredoxin